MNIVLRKMRSAWIRIKRFLLSQRFGFDPAKIYGINFYEDGGFSKTEESAHIICSWIKENLAPNSVLDLGSGSGYYLREFDRLGIQSVGLEASPAGVAKSGSNVLAFTYDLRRPVSFSRKFDVVLCIEVAEHVPKRASKDLVDSICNNSNDYVVFTAAPPGTPGADHINCQEGEYWFALFRAKGFLVNIDLTDKLRHAASKADVAEWWKAWSWCFQRSK